MLLAQSFAPEPGVLGSTAIHQDSSVILFWADQVTIQRGYMDISTTSLGFTTYGTDSDALGQADGLAVVSLGDAGVATYSLSVPIMNGLGPDFAVFENGFIDHYMELAFVEVSTDGVQYVRFPATSEIPIASQLDNFSTSDCRYVHNLAGKYRANYGTPFDLEDLVDSTGIDLMNIRFVRLIDVVGSIEPMYASYDYLGNPINDPFPTPFESGGFDLDALAILHSPEAGLLANESVELLYPNPTSDRCYLRSHSLCTYSIYSTAGQLLLSGDSTQDHSISLADLSSGVYLIRLEIDRRIHYLRIQKN